jgi:hypothetical protein
MSRCSKPQRLLLGRHCNQETMMNRAYSIVQGADVGHAGDPSYFQYPFRSNGNRADDMRERRDNQHMARLSQNRDVPELRAFSKEAAA